MSSIFSLSVSSRHSAEKRNPEKSHSVSGLCAIVWIPRPDCGTVCAVRMSSGFRVVARNDSYRPPGFPQDVYTRCNDDMPLSG